MSVFLGRSRKTSIEAQDEDEFAHLALPREQACTTANNGAGFMARARNAHRSNKRQDKRQPSPQQVAQEFRKLNSKIDRNAPRLNFNGKLTSRSELNDQELSVPPRPRLVADDYKQTILDKLVSLIAKLLKKLDQLLTKGQAPERKPESKTKTPLLKRLFGRAAKQRSL